MSVALYINPTVSIRANILSNNKYLYIFTYDLYVKLYYVINLIFLKLYENL